MVATAALPVSVAAGATSGPTSEPGSVAPGRGDGPGPTFLTRFVARDPGVPVAVAGTVVLRADECASRLVVAREGAGTVREVVPPELACDEGYMRYELDTAALEANVPHTAEIHDATGEVTDRIAFTPVARVRGVVPALPKGVYVTNGWADAPVAAGLRYIEEVRGAVPVWVQGIAVIVAWRTLQPDPSLPLDTARIDEALDYAERQRLLRGGLPLPTIFIVKAGDYATPTWYYQRLGRPAYHFPGGEGVGTLPWDYVMGDLFAAVTSQIAARYDGRAEYPDFAGIYLSGAGTPHYPEMWSSRPTRCGVWNADVGVLGRIDYADFTWDPPGCPVQPALPDPLKQAEAYVSTTRLMASQFTRTTLIAMLDVTPPAEGRNRTTTAMEHILDQGFDTVFGDAADRYTVGVTNPGRHTFDPNNHNFREKDWHKYRVLAAYAERHPVFRLMELGPTQFGPPPVEGSGTPGWYLPTADPAADRYAMREVVRYCAGPAEDDPNRYERYVDADADGADDFDVACDGMIIHRTNLDAAYRVHQWVFDRCTVWQAAWDVWTDSTPPVPTTGDYCEEPAPARPPAR
ncbi:hypothetical protein GCM10022224_002280 [Nonomuraea antimicrobica]|uniref:Uncharacterized protein n=2 Tax=Nonomuraea antimicrobica TaxID=561173 RepID=A0ABP7AZ87_9ACTN